MAEEIAIGEKAIKKLFNNQYIRIVVVMIITSFFTWLFAGASVQSDVKDLQEAVSENSAQDKIRDETAINNQKTIIEFMEKHFSEVMDSIASNSRTTAVLNEKMTGFAAELKRNSMLIDNIRRSP